MAKTKKYVDGGISTIAAPAAPLSKRDSKDAFKQDKRDKKEAFREQMRTYRQGDRLGPRPVRPDFNKPAVPATATAPVVAKPAVTTTAPAAAPAASAATMKKGGSVKKYSKGGSTASKRADGIATQGKTKGRII
jgi:hypothetical protein